MLSHRAFGLNAKLIGAREATLPFAGSTCLRQDCRYMGLAYSAEKAGLEQSQLRTRGEIASVTRPANKTRIGNLPKTAASPFTNRQQTRDFGLFDRQAVFISPFGCP